LLSGQKDYWALGATSGGPVSTRQEAENAWLPHQQAGGRRASRPSLALSDSSAQRQEAQTRARGVARRQPGEADTTFLRRILPISFAATQDLVAFSWRPSPHGKQLFFSVPGNEGNEYGRDLLVVDPYQAHTYAVQVLTLESLGDVTELGSLFFADVDQDGQKELLALLECSLREPAFKDKRGHQHYGRQTSYQTVVFRLLELSSAGRPQYALDPTPRPYLDELPTAAAVRQALAKHLAKPGQRPTPAKPSH
jgi:hypothetical protein